MSEGVRETICTRCVHSKVCGFKERYLSMVKHLNDEFESFMKMENRDFMQFNDPDCKWMEKTPEIPSFVNKKYDNSRLMSPEQLFGEAIEHASLSAATGGK